MGIRSHSLGPRLEVASVRCLAEIHVIKFAFFQRHFRIIYPTFR